MDLVNWAIVRGLILDMDGVLWKDRQPIGDLPAIFSKIRSLGLKFVLATNNATLSVSQYLEKLSLFGVTLDEWQIVTSAQATGRYLRSLFPDGGSLYIIGETGLIKTLQDFGFTHSTRDASAVVVGLDRKLTYRKLKEATLLVRSGVPFIATNLDKTLPTPAGFIPGAGSISVAIEAATDTKPFVVGKPSPEMYHLALERLGLPPEKTMVVGDRIETDIVGAQVLGCKTALVLTGVTTLDRAKSWSPPPDLILENLSSLFS